MKMRMIKDWLYKSWHLWSMRFNAIGLIILSWVQIDHVGVLYVWNLLPDVIRQFLPHNFITIIGMSLFVLAMISRLVHQPKLGEKCDARTPTGATETTED